MDSSPFHDVRSSSRPDNRSRKQLQKFYGYRGVKPSWVGQPTYDVEEFLRTPRHCELCFSVDPILANPRGVRTRTWTKQDQFQNREFNIWPLDRKHGVGRRKRRNCCYVPARWEDERKMKLKGRSLRWETHQAREMLQFASWKDTWEDVVGRSENQIQSLDDICVKNSDPQCHTDVRMSDGHEKTAASSALSSISTAEDFDMCDVSEFAFSTDYQESDDWKILSTGSHI